MPTKAGVVSIESLRLVGTVLRSSEVGMELLRGRGRRQAGLKGRRGRK